MFAGMPLLFNRCSWLIEPFSFVCHLFCRCTFAFASMFSESLSNFIYISSIITCTSLLFIDLQRFFISFTFHWCWLAYLYLFTGSHWFFINVHWRFITVCWWAFACKQTDIDPSLRLVDVSSLFAGVPLFSHRCSLTLRGLSRVFYLFGWHTFVLSSIVIASPSTFIDVSSILAAVPLFFDRVSFIFLCPLQVYLYVVHRFSCLI